jgi:hypothetical protein
MHAEDYVTYLVKFLGFVDNAANTSFNKSEFIP